MANFMDLISAESELPIDGVDDAANPKALQAGLLYDFANGGCLRQFSGLDVAFGKAPVLVAVADQQLPRHAPVESIDDPSGGGLFADCADHQSAATPLPLRLGRPSMNCRTTGSVVWRISSTVPT